MKKNILWFALLTMFLFAENGVSRAAVPPPPPPLPPLVLGVSHTETSPDIQMDRTRDLEVFGYVYNSSSHNMIVDWRTRRLRCHHMTADNSKHDYEGTTEIKPGQLIFFKDVFFFKRRCCGPKHFLFSVRDEGRNVYEVPTVPKETNAGPFDGLPRALQSLITEAFINDADMRYNWWYKKY